MKFVPVCAPQLVWIICSILLTRSVTSQKTTQRVVEKFSWYGWESIIQVSTWLQQWKTRWVQTRYFLWGITECIHKLQILRVFYNVMFVCHRKYPSKEPVGHSSVSWNDCSTSSSCNYARFYWTSHFMVDHQDTWTREIQLGYVLDGNSSGYIIWCLYWNPERQREKSLMKILSWINLTTLGKI